MTKKKKAKAKRVRYPHVIKTDYLIALANKIHCTAPQEQIIFNTLRDVYSTGYTGGYIRKCDEVSRFRHKQQQHMDAEFKKFQDSLDDMIHIKNQPCK